MQVDLEQVVRKMKVVMADLQYQLLSHQVAVEVLESDNEDLQQQVIDLNRRIIQLEQELSNEE